MNEEEMKRLGFQADLDQGVEFQKMIAKLVHSNFSELFKAGFTRSEAFALTKLYYENFTKMQFDFRRQRK